MSTREISLRLVDVRGYRLLADLTLLYVAPVVLLFTGVIPFRFRFVVLTFMAFAAILLGLSRGYTAASLGLKRPAVASLLGWMILPAAVGLGILYPLGLVHRFAAVPSAWFYVFFIAISAPAQEFLYRSFLSAMLESNGVKAQSAMIVISAALFAGMHLIFRDSLTFVLTLAVGLLWGAVFSRTRNFYFIAASHAGLGALAIRLGAV